jgi:hypothetical protein
MGFNRRHAVEMAMRAFGTTWQEANDSLPQEPQRMDYGFYVDLGKALEALGFEVVWR